MNQELAFEAMPFEVDLEFEGNSEAEDEWGRRRSFAGSGAGRYPRPRSQTGLPPRGAKRLPTPRPRPTPARPRGPWVVVREPYGLVSEPYPSEPEPSGSERVRWIQDCLNQAMGLQLPLTGVMGPETRSAVRKFQQQQGLRVSGSVSPKTEQTLSSVCEGGQDAGAPSEELEDFWEVLASNGESIDTGSGDVWQGEVSRGSPDYIRWMQQSLNRILGLQLAVDGNLGLQTRSAIRRFQQRQGLVVDGVVGSRTERALITAGASPPPGSGAPLQPSAVPAAAQTPALLNPPERTPPAYTLYVDIPLNIPLGKAKSMTGIFVPENFCPLPQVDLIVYLHGFKLRSHKPDYSIDRYWRLPKFFLREEINKSQKNVILVAPTLGPKNEPGDLIAPGVFDKFLDQVMVTLKQYGPYAGGQKTPSVGRLIVACHSGSGGVMRKIAEGSARYATQIQECWAFDPFNVGDAKLWANWAQSHPQSKLYIYYGPNNPGQQLCQNLMGKRMPNLSPVKCMPNVFAVKSIVGHDDIPARYLKDRTQGAQFLIDKSNCPSNQTLDRR